MSDLSRLGMREFGWRYGLNQLFRNYAQPVW
jgi:hypothetical protein